MAQARGIPVRSITLFALGGIAQMEKDANSAKSEFLIAIVGPITSFLIGFGCLARAYLARLEPRPEAAPAAGVASAACSAGSDRSTSCSRLQSDSRLSARRRARAARGALGALRRRMGARPAAPREPGQVVAGLFIAFGLLQFFLGAGLGGLWLAFIGWFLLSAAQASYAQVALTEALRGVRVADIMSQRLRLVDPARPCRRSWTTCAPERHRCVMVAQRPCSASSRPEVRDRPRPLARGTGHRGDASARSCQSVTPDTPAIEALETMAREDLNQLPVLRSRPPRGPRQPRADPAADPGAIGAWPITAAGADPRGRARADPARREPCRAGRRRYRAITLEGDLRPRRRFAVPAGARSAATGVRADRTR
jgi:CBS domain-containing protein